MSTNAATEWHVNAKMDEEDLSNPTKDLTRGTQDVNGRNTGCTEDPCRSFEASAKGTSAKHAEMTPVVLKSKLPHKMQDQPQDSLQATPYVCEQEAVDSNVTAGRMNWMAEMAKPMEITDVDSEKAVLGRKPAERACRVDEGDEMNADIDRTATLGEDPATMACRVDKGDGMERRDLWLQQTNLLCEETRQRNGNAEEDIPSTQRLPLEGEWAGCASGESNKLKGCSRSREVEPADMSNESETLVTLSIESEDPHSGETPRVYLGGMWMHADDTNGLGCRMDGSRSQADGLGGLTDALNASSRPEMANVSHGDKVNTYLGVRHAKCGDEVMDGVGSHAHTLTGHGEALSIETHALIPTTTPGIVRTT